KPVVVELGSVGSTNGEALRLAATIESGAPLADWVTASQQTQGRGRHGRHWHSPPGNLYATRLLRTSLPVQKIVELTLVTGIAVHDAVSTLLDGAATVELKWPNDVLADGAKIAGILIQTEPGGAQTAVAIGIGINVVVSPPGGPASTSMGAHGWHGDSTQVFDALAGSLENWIGVWSKGTGFAAIRDAWAARSMPVGSRVRVRLPGETIHGTVAGLDPTGALLLRLADGAIRKITTGDVLTDMIGNKRQDNDLESAGGQQGVK
ncbi:MAG: biotin--[acetyl-CoA-carboxylase] ligase, partial [Hyphomicrobiales bacterium]